MSTKSFTRDIVIDDKKMVEKFKSALHSDNSFNLKTSIKNIKEEEFSTKNKVIKSILKRY